MIALHHLDEMIDYYDKLAFMEGQKMEDGGNIYKSEDDLQREERYELARLSDELYRYQRLIANASHDDVDEAIKNFYEARKRYKDFELSIENRQDKIRRAIRVSNLIEDEHEDYEKHGSSYEYLKLYKKDPRLAALQSQKDMIEFNTSSYYKELLMKEGDSEDEANEKINNSIERHNRDIQDLEIDLKENPIFKKK